MVTSVANRCSHSSFMRFLKAAASINEEKVLQRNATTTFLLKWCMESEK